MSDGITATIERPWTLETIDCCDRTQIKIERTGRKVTAKDAEGEPILDANGQPVKIDEEVIILQRAPTWTLVRTRKIVGMTRYRPQNGQIKSVFGGLVTGPITRLNLTSIGRIGTGKKFICIHDKPTVTNAITGETVQRQVWMYQGPWENMNPRLFGGYNVSSETPPDGANT